jgi:hypothetical protein
MILDNISKAAAVLGGRLLGDQQVLRRFGQVDRLVCHFDEHEQNIVENQLLMVITVVLAIGWMRTYWNS